MAINCDYTVQQPCGTKCRYKQAEYCGDMTSSEDLNDRTHRFECTFFIFFLDRHAVEVLETPCSPQQTVRLNSIHSKELF